MVENDDRQDGGQTQAESQNQSQDTQSDVKSSETVAKTSQDGDTNPELDQQSESASESADDNQSEGSSKQVASTEGSQDGIAKDQDAQTPENVQSSELDEEEDEGVEAEEEVQPEPEKEQPQHYAREQLRAEIETKAGDSQSILGTTADATQLLLLLVSRVLRALNGSSDPAFASIKSELAPFAAIAEGFLDKVENGTVKMPALVKGLEAVVAEVEERSTRVASVIEQHKKQQSPTSDDGGA